MNELLPLFDNLITVSVGLCGLCFVIVSLIMLKFPPRKINALYGYRTNSSMKSQEQWDFAQHFSAKIMLKCGILMLLMALIGIFLQDSVSKTVQIIFSAVVIFAPIIFLIYKTEKALRQKIQEPRGKPTRYES